MGSDKPATQPAMNLRIAVGVLVVIACVSLLWLKGQDPGSEREGSNHSPDTAEALEQGTTRHPLPGPRSVRKNRQQGSNNPGGGLEAVTPDDLAEADDLLDSDPASHAGTEPDKDGWYTRQASGERDQRSLAPDDPDYDPVTEARQLFFPLEEALQAARPLSPASYKEVLGNHKDTSAEIFTRASDLLRQGQTEAAKQLLAEWNRLYLVYKDETYPAQARPRTGIDRLQTDGGAGEDLP